MGIYECKSDYLKIRKEEVSKIVEEITAHQNSVKEKSEKMKVDFCNC